MDFQSDAPVSFLSDTIRVPNVVAGKLKLREESPAIEQGHDI